MRRWDFPKTMDANAKIDTLLEPPLTIPATMWSFYLPHGVEGGEGRMFPKSTNLHVLDVMNFSRSELHRNPVQWLQEFS